MYNWRFETTTTITFGLISLTPVTDHDMRDWQLNKKKILERSQFALENSLLSDCSFLVGKEPNSQIFNCHKIILAWASPVFQAMYIYTDSINLKSFDLGCDLLYAAKKYILPYVVERCKTYLVSNLTHENVCRVYEFAKLLEEPEIVERCLKLMQEKTDKILTDPSFQEIEQSTLVILLEQKCLMVASELNLINASLHWAKREAEHKDLDATDGSILREVLGPAFGLLRFLTLIPSEFASGPALWDLLSREERFAILVNLNSPNSMAIPDGICTSTEQRHCPRNDDFIWDALLHSTNLCERQCNIENPGILECTVTFTVSKDIRIIGIQIPSQITPCGKVINKDTYHELIIITLTGSNKNLMCSSRFEKEVPFNSVINFNFEHSVEAKQEEEHSLRVWLHRKGRYPRCKLESTVQCGDVSFEFQENNTDVIRSLTFTPASATDSKTFKFTSPTPQEPNPKPRKFHFVPRKSSGSPFKI
ncbi:hypothetical protein B566_EDAN011289 [Ephemera danica]|nr:hypothetical protein B566_EDAN011289 [Ephemera danica]